MQRILTLAIEFENKLQKLSENSSDLSTIKTIVKQSLENLFKLFPSIMYEFLYASNFRTENNNINFILNLDKNKLNQANKPQRDNLITKEIKKNLKNKLNQDFNITYTENII